KFCQRLNIGVRKEALPRWVLTPPMLACAREAWPDIESQFQKIQPSELLDRLESVLGRVAFGPTSSDKRIETELTFESWCLANGLKIPGEAQNKYDEFRKREIEERQREEQEVYDRFWGDSRAEFRPI